jgi:hypothetical protein
MQEANGWSGVEDCLHRPAASHQTDYGNDYRDDKYKVDQATGDMEAPTHNHRMIKIEKVAQSIVAPREAAGAARVWRCHSDSGVVSRFLLLTDFGHLKA